MGHSRAEECLWNDPRLVLTPEQRLVWMERYAANHPGTAYETKVVSAFIEHHFRRAEYAEALRWHAMVQSRYEALGKMFVDEHKYIVVMYYEGLGTSVDYRRAALYANDEVRELDGYLTQAGVSLSTEEWRTIATHRYESVCWKLQWDCFRAKRLSEGLYWYDKVGESVRYHEYELAQALEQAGRYAEAVEVYEHSLPRLSEAKAAAAKEKMAELRQKLQA